MTIGWNRGDRRIRRDVRREEVFWFALCGLCVLGGFFLSAQQPPPKPSFQSSVEVTSLDVTVVDDRGKPITNLTPADFNVRIDGNAIIPRIRGSAYVNADSTLILDPNDPFVLGIRQ